MTAEERLAHTDEVVAEKGRCLMPNHEQMKAVVREIELFLGGLSVVCIEEKHGIPPSEGRRFLFWDELTEEHRKDALASEIHWEGFTEGQKDEVIRRVIDGPGPEYWMAEFSIDDHARAELAADRIKSDACVEPEDQARVMLEAAHDPFPGGAAEMQEESDPLPTPDEWRRLQAEWSHDYGLRHLEERGVRYEDAECADPPSDYQMALDAAARRAPGRPRQKSRELER